MPQHCARSAHRHSLERNSLREREAGCHSLTDLQGVLECKSRLVEIPPPEVQMTHPLIRHGNAIGMADRLRYLDRLCASDYGFDKLPALSQR